MTCGNPIKHKFQQVFDNWLDMFSVERELSDEQKNIYKQEYYVEKVELKKYHKALANEAKEAEIANSWGNLDKLEWIRYEKGNMYWEFVIKGNKYLIREGDGKKHKFITREYKTTEAIQISIDSLIKMHRLIGYTHI